MQRHWDFYRLDEGSDLEAPDLVATPDRRVLGLGAGATAGSAELFRVVIDRVGARG